MSRSSRAELGEFVNAYAPARDELALASSMDQVGIDRRRKDLAVATANLGVVRTLARKLPRACWDSDSGDLSFTLSGKENVQQASRIQANTLWWRGHFPTYLIGKQPGSRKGLLDIMLLHADTNPNKNPIVATVKKSRFLAARERALHAQEVPYGEGLRGGMYDEGTGSITVQSGSPGNIPVKGVCSTFAAIMDGVPSSIEVPHGITSHMMEAFDVEGHLNPLAANFDRAAVLDRAYASRDRTIARIEQ